MILDWRAEEEKKDERFKIGGDGEGGLGKVVPYQGTNWSHGWRDESSES